MYGYNNYSDREFDDLTIRWSALNSEVAAARARQKQGCSYKLSSLVGGAFSADVKGSSKLMAAICSAAAVILIFLLVARHE